MQGVNTGDTADTALIPAGQLQQHVAWVLQQEQQHQHQEQQQQQQQQQQKHWLEERQRLQKLLDDIQQVKKQEQFYARFRFVTKLGGGSFGTTYEALDLQESRRVAIKFIELVASGEGIDALRTVIWREVLNQRTLKHSNIVPLYSVYLLRRQTGYRLALVMKLVTGGRLLDHVEACIFTSDVVAISEDRARWFFQQLIVTLDYMHSQQVAHRDIKLQNLLVEVLPGYKYPVLQLCDFGLSKSLSQDVASTDVGTQVYKAPEVFKPVECIAASKRTSGQQGSSCMQCSLERCPLGPAHLRPHSLQWTMMHS